MYWEGEYIPAGPPAKVPSDEELRVARAVDDMTNFIRDNELPKAREMLEKEPGLANGLTWTGATALMNVVCGNYRAGMELLFEFGADPTIQHKQFKRDGTSAFKNSSANARCYLSHKRTCLVRCTHAAFGYAERFGEKETLELINKLAGRAEEEKSKANPPFPGSDEEKKAKSKKATATVSAPAAVEVSDPVEEPPPEKLIVEG